MLGNFIFFDYAKIVKKWQNRSGIQFDAQFDPISILDVTCNFVHFYFAKIVQKIVKIGQAYNLMHTFDPISIFDVICDFK